MLNVDSQGLNRSMIGEAQKAYKVKSKQSPVFPPPSFPPRPSVLQSNILCFCLTQKSYPSKSQTATAIKMKFFSTFVITFAATGILALPAVRYMLSIDDHYSSSSPGKIELLTNYGHKSPEPT